ncbi:MAG TPA: hypothetical protein VF453_06590 [Burkholderiaceae bacterium]
MKGLNFDKIRARLEAIPEGFAERVAKVGWFPAAQYKDGTPVAYVAAIQENGYSAGGIQARPFIRPTIADRKGAWVKVMADGMRAVVKGRASAEQVLDGVGLQAAGDIAHTLGTASFAPLSPVTLMLRKMRDDDPSLVMNRRAVAEAAARVARGEAGSTRTDPLHDTGLMISSLTHLVGEAE